MEKGVLIDRRGKKKGITLLYQYANNMEEEKALKTAMHRQRRSLSRASVNDRIAKQAEKLRMAQEMNSILVSTLPVVTSDNNETPEALTE